jgi:aspartate carbamoyltransferase catalytic subunit
MSWTRKDLLAMRDLDAAEIREVLDTAASMKEIAGREIKKVPTLRGKTVVNLFYEASTRTRTSFEIAGKWLSADVINFSASGSSVEKGESLLDTARNIEAMSPDVLVVRHRAAGAPALLARHLRCAVVNAGDGAHEHPTQALLDLLTIREKKGHLEGLEVAIVGDIAHSRVARSNILGMRTMGMTVTVAGPPTLIPAGCPELGVKVAYRLEEAIARADVIMMLRVQHERMQGGLIPSLREYSRCWGLTVERLRHCRPDVLIMHPGPVNRGVELAPEVADGPYSVILDQVANGVAVRMAVLYLLAGAGRAAEAAPSRAPDPAAAAPADARPRRRGREGQA